MKLYTQILENAKPKEEEILGPFTFGQDRKSRTQPLYKKGSQKSKPKPLSLGKKILMSPGASSGYLNSPSEDPNTPLITISKKPFSQMPKNLCRSSSMTGTQMSEIDDQYLSPIKSYRDHRPTYDIIQAKESNKDKFHKVRLAIKTKSRKRYTRSFNKNTKKPKEKKNDKMRKSCEKIKIESFSRDMDFKSGRLSSNDSYLQSDTGTNLFELLARDNGFDPKSQTSSERLQEIKIMKNLDELISKSNKFLDNNEAREILMLHKQLLYEDREILGDDPNHGENPFLVEENDSGYEDSETDDHKTTMLRHLKRSVDVMQKYKSVHKKDSDLSESGISRMSARRIIQSPLKLSLSQIFQGCENDDKDKDSIKQKFFKRLGRDFHFHPNYESNVNVMT